MLQTGPVPTYCQLSEKKNNMDVEITDSDILNSRQFMMAMQHMSFWDLYHYFIIEIFLTKKFVD